MALHIGDAAPDFTSDTSTGKIKRQGSEVFREHRFRSLAVAMMRAGVQ